MDERNWSNISLAHVTDVGLPGRIVSSVCLVVTTLTLLLLIFHKAYTSTLQRLLLYLTIVTVIQEPCLTVGYTTQFEYSGHKKFCDAIGIFWQWSNTVGYLLTLAMIVFLPYKIYEQFKGNPFPRLSRSRCFRIALECLFVFIVLVLPLAYILPFISAFTNCAYFLLQSEFCRVSFMSIVNCTTQQLVSSLVPSYVAAIDFIGIFIVTTALSVVFCCLAREYRETRITLRRTLILLVFFVAYIVISLIFSTGVYAAKPDILAKLLIFVKVVLAAVLPVLAAVFPLGFLFYLYYFNLFHWRAIKRAAAEWRCFVAVVEEKMHHEKLQLHPTLITAPSVTFFDVPHSRMTTDIPSQEQQVLLPDGGGDRGHGTIMNV